MRAQITYTYEGCHVAVMNADHVEVARAYEPRDQHDSWEACKAAALRRAQGKLARWDAPPEPETIAL